MASIFVAYLEVLRRENLLETCGPGWASSCRAGGLQRSTSLIADVRGLGLILGMEMAAYPAASVAGRETAARVQRATLGHSLIVKIGGRDDRVVRILPPLNVTRQTTDDALAIITSAVTAVQRNWTLGGR